MKENSFLLVVLLDFQVCLGFSLTSGMTFPVSRFTRHEATNPTSQHSTWLIHKTVFFRPGGWLRYARSRDQIAKPILAFWHLGAGDFGLSWRVPPEVGWKWCGNVGKIETLMNIITYQVQVLCDVMYDFLYLDPCRKMQESVCRSRIYTLGIEDAYCTQSDVEKRNSSRYSATSVTILPFYIFCLSFTNGVSCVSTGKIIISFSSVRWWNNGHNHAS